MKFAGKLLELQKKKNNPERGNPDQKDTQVMHTSISGN